MCGKETADGISSRETARVHTSLCEFRKAGVGLIQQLVHELRNNANYKYTETYSEETGGLDVVDVKRFLIGINALS